VALFSYAHVPWLKKQQGSFAAHLPEGMQKFAIFRTGLSKFLEGGYLYIGMDHFAKPGDELAISQQKRTLHRNFQGYTTKAGADLYGMGVTAISGIQNAYAQNHRELAAWEKAVGERGIATLRGYRLFEFDQYFADELARLEAPREDGLVFLEPDQIRTTWLGRIFIRNLAMVFDPYLEKQQLAAKPLFSKTL
jgi:oxygen-independent coproporphyrinogen-3 oxidase